MTTQNEVESKKRGPRWCCIPCELQWNGATSLCWCCGGIGERFEGNGPVGWPKTVVTAGMAR